MKNKNKFHGNQHTLSNKEKRKFLSIWAFVIFLGFCMVNSQLTVLYLPDNIAHAQEAPKELEDRLGEILDPKGMVVIKQGKDPAWGVIKEPKTIKARVTWYSVADSCHFPAKDGGCYSANYPHKIQRGDMACPKEYKFGTKVEYNGVPYTCNDRTADWVQDKWAEPTFDIYVPTSKEVKGRVFGQVTIK